MNYIKELNAFYDRLETNPLSSSAVALWHALMHINNKTGWTDEFNVSISVLCIKTGLSERTISKARSELREKGYIDFCSKKGRQPANYQLCSLIIKNTDKQPEIISDNHADNDTDNTSEQSSNLSLDIQNEKNTENISDKRADNRAGNCAASVKQNKTKQNESFMTNQLSLYEAFEKNFNRIPTPMQMEIITSFIDQDGLPEELVIYGLSIAGEKGKPLSYAKTILTNWSKANIRSVGEAKTESKQYQSRQTKNKRLPKVGGEQYEFNPVRNHVDPKHVTAFKFYT